MRIAIYNNKGGVGKTTTAVNLGAALARLGHKTLVVDVDPQRHVAEHLGITDRVAIGLEEAFQRRDPARLEDILVELPPNLWVAPCTQKLNEARRELETRINSTTVLDARLRKMELDFDFIVLDTPPDRGVFSRNAMYAAEVILVPINLESFAVSGIDPVMDEIAELQDAYDDRGWIIRVATLRFDGRLRHSNQICGEQMREVFGSTGYLLDTRIRTDARLGAAQIAGLSIFDFDDEKRPGKPPSKSAEDYLAMAKEFSAMKVGRK